MKLVNAVPVAGFITRPDEDVSTVPTNDNFLRSTSLKLAPSQLESVIDVFKNELPTALANPDILSFIVLKSLEEPDTIITWERYSSQDAFARQGGQTITKTLETLSPRVIEESTTLYRRGGGYLINTTP